jgi:hypothetical protein
MKNINRAPQRITPLSIGEHKGLAVQIPKNYSFARGINSVPLTITEFGHASISYPIVFTQSVFGLTPIALLGLRSAQNLCIDSDGAWMEEYVPSFLKHYPFFIGRDTDGLKVCIDEDWEGCNRIGRGEVLFDSEGAPTSFLKHIIASLSGYQKQTVITQEIMNRLSGLDVFEEGKIDYINDSNGSNRIRGVYIINREKLLELNPAVLRDLNSLHLLEYCFNHIHSLSTLGKLFNRMRDSGDPNYSEIKNFS